MKKKFFILALLSLLVAPFQGCQGPSGPSGPQGPAGRPGINILAEVFEVGPVNFRSQNGYEVQFPLNPAIYDSDVVLVYELAGIIGGRDLWKLVPQTYVAPDGMWWYGFSFTTNAFAIYVDAEFDDLSLIPDEGRFDKFFRIVIVPGTFDKDFNFNDYDATMSMLNVKENQIQSIDLKN